jgi:signal peptidase I
MTDVTEEAAQQAALSSSPASASAGDSAPVSRWEIARAVTRLTTVALVTGITTTALSLFAWSMLPLALGWQPSVVLTGSMVPAIQPGDIVVTAPVDHRDLRIGHVIRFVDPSRPDRFLVHRIVTVNSDGTMVTRGDANGSNDTEPVPPESITGVGRLRVPFIGLPALWLRERAVLPLGITVLMVALVAHVVSGLRTAIAGDAGGGRHHRRRRDPRPTVHTP